MPQARVDHKEGRRLSSGGCRRRRPRRPPGAAGIDRSDIRPVEVAQGGKQPGRERAHIVFRAVGRRIAARPRAAALGKAQNGVAGAEAAADIARGRLAAAGDDRPPPTGHSAALHAGSAHGSVVRDLTEHGAVDVQLAEQSAQLLRRNAARRSRRGRSPVRSTIVDSTPTSQGPPSRMASMRPSMSCRTWAAVVVEGLPEPVGRRRGDGHARQPDELTRRGRFRAADGDRYPAPPSCASARGRGRAASLSAGRARSAPPAATPARGCHGRSTPAPSARRYAK